MDAVYSFVIIFEYAFFEMVWTEKVHTFLFCPERGGEITVVKSPLCVQKAAKEKTEFKEHPPLPIYMGAGEQSEV